MHEYLLRCQQNIAEVRVHVELQTMIMPSICAQN